jgi:hypothetical protein
LFLCTLYCKGGLQKNFSNWSPDSATLNKRLALFTISVGSKDFLYESVKQKFVFYKEKGLEVKTYIAPGVHTWMNCKKHLATTLQELFK